MASVYKAYQAKLDRYVALKVLPQEFLHEGTFAQRFEREARVVAKLDHANIVPGRSPGRRWTIGDINGLPKVTEGLFYDPDRLRGAERKRNLYRSATK